MNKTAFNLFVLTFLYLISNFLAPLTLDPGTVQGMDARANAPDYQEEWWDMMEEGHVFEGITYLLGDINCHQKHERSYTINDNQMPVCTRDIGMFAGGSVGFFFLMILATARFEFYDTFFSPLPKELRERLYSKLKPNYIFYIILISAVVPIGLDGGIQAVTSYESTNPMRMATGSWFGFIAALVFGSILMSGVPEEDYIASALAAWGDTDVNEEEEEENGKTKERIKTGENGETKETCEDPEKQKLSVESSNPSGDSPRDQELQPKEDSQGLKDQETAQGE